jgi:hypothetical protein
MKLVSKGNNSLSRKHWEREEMGESDDLFDVTQEWSNTKFGGNCKSGADGRSGEDTRSNITPQARTSSRLRYEYWSALCSHQS